MNVVVSNHYMSTTTCSGEREEKEKTAVTRWSTARWALGWGSCKHSAQQEEEAVGVRVLWRLRLSFLAGFRTRTWDAGCGDVLRVTNKISLWSSGEPWREDCEDGTELNLRNVSLEVHERRSTRGARALICATSYRGG